MTLVDLHIHTTFSDGHNTPSEVVKMAQENNVSVIAIADHDNVAGIEEGLAAGKKYGVTVVPGVEISTGFHGSRLHILGLGVNHKDASLISFLKKIYDHRKNVMVAKLEDFNKERRLAGDTIVDTVDFAQSQGDYFSHGKTAEYLELNGFAKDRNEIIKKLFNIRVGGEFPVTPPDVVTAVHKAGGLVILAHPLAKGASLRKLDLTADGQEKLLKELIDVGIDGFECYQSEHDSNDVLFATQLAKKYNQLISGGSDWHGDIEFDEDIKNRKSTYPEHIGGLGVTTEMVAPLLARLGVPRA